MRQFFCLITGILVLLSACFPEDEKEKTTPPEEAPIEEPASPSDFPIDEPDCTATVSVDTAIVPEPVKWVPYPNGIPLKNGQAWPVDQAPANPDFLAFRDSLMEAITRKDVDYLLTHVDEHIKPSIADGEGKDFFIEMWRLAENAEKSDIWKEMEQILNLGGIFYDAELTRFSAPYLFHLDEMDISTEELVIGEGVRLRKQAGSAGEVMGKLSYEVVRRAPVDWDKPEPVISEKIDGEEHNWQKVITQANDTGYIYGKYLRSPIDLRAHFNKKPEGWRMVSLLAGD